MFTGIVQGMAVVTELLRDQGLVQLWLEFPEGKTAELVVGASVAVAGTCLTAVTIADHRVQFDCIDETLARTTLGDLAVGDRVNFERAAKVGDEIGGHLVSGHVLGKATIVDRREGDGNLVLGLRPPEEARPYLLPKGFVTLDGVSLTVGRVGADGDFDVHLIPETRRVTSLGTCAVGGQVNLEVDAMTQAVVATTLRVLERLQIP